MRQLYLLFILGILLACGDAKNNRAMLQEESAKAKPTPSVTNLSGKALSESYCASCHAYVDPKLLPKSVWQEDVLPAMGRRLGIHPEGYRPNNLFDPGASGTIVRKANIFPEHPLLAEEDWNKIVNYIVDGAPDTIPPPVRKKNIRMGLPHFRYKPAPFVHRPPLTTLVKILPANKGIVFSDGKGKSGVLTFLNADLKENYSIPLQSTPVQFTERNNEVLLTTMGRGVFPNDAPDGTLQRLTRTFPDPKYSAGETILTSLQRPACMAYGDLNGDGQEDIVVCEFGNFTGRLSWYAGNGQGGYTRKVLRDKPGAITAIIRDANNDGLPDIYVLMAQAEEGIFLYENQGSGEFREKQLLAFTPLHGSQFMELADFNGDGFDDIVYVCGDNADLTPILKQYHGIYIFLNDRKSGFSQAYFYPLNGAYKAMVRDYDLDGDLDIAAISFFPDYPRYREESFVYLRNNGNLTFQDFSFPQAHEGRWMVMDAADMDGDGDVDIALGSFVYFLPDGDTTGLGKKWLESSPSVSILENTTR